MGESSFIIGSFTSLNNLKAQVTQRHNGGHQEEDASHEGGEGQCHGQG